jgi:hypothetical protein
MPIKMHSATQIIESIGSIMPWRLERVPGVTNELSVGVHVEIENLIEVFC